MPLFRCTKCGCVENTALGHYWMTPDKPECSECHTGKWHNRFPKRSASGYKIEQGGFLWSQEEIDAGQLPSHYKIVGEVP